MTWQSYQQDGSEWGIYGQRFAVDGSKAGSEFLINTLTDRNQEAASVTSLGDAGFIVTWESYQQIDGHDWGISGQRFAADGNKVGS